MANVRVEWVLPTTKFPSGKPLPIDQIRSFEVAISADQGSSWVVTDEFGVDVGATQFTDLEPGVWSFRGVTIDKAGRRGVEAFGQVEIVAPDESGPDAAVLTVTLLP
jgi:hypothetical protein